MKIGVKEVFRLIPYINEGVKVKDHDEDSVDGVADSIELVPAVDVLI